MKSHNPVIEGTKSGIQNFGIAAVDALVMLHPELLPAWLLIRGLWGALFQFEQDRINEFAQFIKENPDKFTKEITSSPEFQEGFVVTFEQYFKQRGEEKRRIVQRIFLGFTASKDKEKFELERMYSVLSQISFEALEYLKFLKEKVIPELEKNAHKQTIHIIKDSALHHGKSRDYWYAYNMRHGDIQEYSKLARNRKREDDFGVWQNYNELHNELFTLGVFSGNFGQVSSYSFSAFGLKFIQFIEKE